MESLPNESFLVKQMQSGDENAFTLLYRYYSPKLYSNIVKMIRDPLLAEEMVQELFTRIWQKKESKGIIENFQGYIYRTGQNLVHDFFRKVKRDRLLMEKFQSLLREDYVHIEESLEFRQSVSMLNKAIGQLSPQQKQVYELVKVEGYEYKKAAEIMGISPHTVKEYLAAAKKSIKIFLLNNMDDTLAFLLVCVICTI